jgi:hypothetical protein
MIYRIPTDEDLEIIQNYADGPAQKYTGMTYAQGIQDMIDWLEGSPRPGEEE